MKFFQKHKLILFLVLVCMATIPATTQNVWAETGKNAFQLKSVNVQSQIETDGAMSVVDQRTLQVNDSTKVINWEISKTTDKSKIEVSSARLIFSDREGTFVSAVDIGELSQDLKQKLDDSKMEGPDNICYYNEEDSWFYAYLPSVTSGQEVVLEVSYTINNAFYVYDDVTEVYWDYLPQEKLSDFQKLFPKKSTIDISCTILIPATPENEVVNKQNVWAWGHGFEGKVEFLDVGAYKFTSHCDSLDKNSRAHLIFPRSCLVNFSNGSAMDVGGARKNNAITEEETWSDSSRVITANECYVSGCVFVLSAIVLLIMTLAYFRMTKKYKTMLVSSVSVQEQTAFDRRAMKLQVKFLVVGVLALLLFLYLIISAKDVYSSVALLILFVMCIIFANWTPTIHSSFRDRI